MHILLPLLVALFSCFTTVYACGCYGPCSLPPTLPCQGAPGTVNVTACICDCCPACNRYGEVIRNRLKMTIANLLPASCDQLFAGCQSDKWQNDLILSPPPPSVLTIGTSVTSNLLRANSGNLNYFIGACVQPTLPNGLSLNLNTSAGFVALEGTPTISSPLTDYTIIAKGGVNYIGRMTVQLSVAWITTKSSYTVSFFISNPSLSIHSHIFFDI